MPPSKTQINKAGKHLAAFLGGNVPFRELRADQQDELAAAVAIVSAYRGEHATPLRATNANLRSYVVRYGAVSVTQRLKKLPTIIDKLRREPAMQLTTMEDIGGLRVVLPEQQAIDEVVRRLRKNWQVTRHRDYVRSPKASGYRAVHLVVRKQGVAIEVQLRTTLQDAWANQVEGDSRYLRTDLKSGRGAVEIHEYYVAVSELLALRDQGRAASEAVLSNVRLRYAQAKPFLMLDR